MVATSAQFVAVLAAAAGHAGQQSRDPAGHKAAYVKRELFIPMRDGVKLFTIVYAPQRHVAHAIRS